jgi:hypothetical protein
MDGEHRLVHAVARQDEGAGALVTRLAASGRIATRETRRCGRCAVALSPRPS